MEEAEDSAVITEGEVSGAEVREVAEDEVEEEEEAVADPAFAPSSY